MKRIFSLFLLIVALGSLIYITHYTLNNKGIRIEVKQKEKANIEKVSSNENKNNLSEIYNIYLNKEKHKVKIEYQKVEKDNDLIGVTLYVYFDGKNVMERDVVREIDSLSVPEIMKNSEISPIIRIQEKRFHFLKVDEDYLVMDVGFYGENSQRYYYVINGNGDLLTEEGILVWDSSKDYLMEEMDFSGYYNLEDKTLAQIDDNAIFALEEKSSKDKLILQEMKYFIQNGKLETELVKTYENISLRSKKTETKK